MNKITQISFKKGNTHIMYVIESTDDLTSLEKERLEWILNPNLTQSQVSNDGYNVLVGPNLRFETPESEKLRAICRSFGLTKTVRIEEFKAFLLGENEIPEHDVMTQCVYRKVPETLVPIFEPAKTQIIDLIGGGLDLFQKVNKDFGMGMDEFDMKEYHELFTKKYMRNPTDVELMQIAQGNSSHSRHWEFSGKFIIDGEEMNKTLFEMVKETRRQNPHGSVKAFKDNGGILEGGEVEMFFPGPDGVYQIVRMNMDHTATAETHNHPTLISPYPGAATGVGGRLRDIAAIGRGSLIGFGGVYFQTGKLWLNEEAKWKYPKNMATPREVLVGAIKGASGYGNPFGEPTLLFGNDSLGFLLPNGERFETIKPIIYTCAVGSIPAGAKDKAEAEPNMTIVRIGGATRRIGTGGGAASSMDAGDNSVDLDFASVQRGEPMIGRSVYNVIEHCIFMGEENPIDSIHDQGAGGASNVLTELTNRCGGVVDMGCMQIADPSLSQMEAWISEAQELYGLLVKPENVELLKKICAKYSCLIEILGETNDSQKISVVDSRDGSVPVDLTLPEILGKLPQKTYVDSTTKFEFSPLVLPDVSIKEHLQNIAKVPGVALLNYMVDHFDGSVGGRVVQGPRDGVYQLPICNYGIISDSFSGTSGALEAFICSNPVAMLIDEEATARMTVAQTLATLSFVNIPGGIEHVKARLNVMWPFKQPGMKAKLCSAYKAITDALIEAGIGIDGGKDSLSLSVKFDDQTVMSFPTFILGPYAHLDDFRSRITPALKSKNSSLIVIELEPNKNRMGGSAIAGCYDQTGNEVPDADMVKARKLFECVQQLVKENKILAGGAKQKGGLLPTVAKMSVASHVEAHVTLPDGVHVTDFYFNEEIGVVLQCEEDDVALILKRAHELGLHASVAGWVKRSSQYFSFYDRNQKYSPFASDVRAWFSETGKVIKEHLGINPHLLELENYSSRQSYKLTFNPDEDAELPEDRMFNVAVLCAPGTNGHHELAYMFGRLGKQFRAQRVEMEELMSGEYDLKDFNVVLWPGGFSYGDVGGSGKGWAASVLFNERLKKMLDDFYARPDTLSFGVCNGFQVATLLGLLDDSVKQEPLLMHNDSGMFEHRPVNLLIPENTKSIMFQGMQGSILPAWSAHGEGKLFLPDYNYDLVEKAGLVSVQYANSQGFPTCDYPLNPNGSPNGIAGLCTKDGRHTFMMPHIERVSASNHHLPYRPDDWNFEKPVWMKAVENMYLWLYENVKS
ncbi:MAG: phosphoribosylformylglycinamidine synthase [Candidatus Paceibacterota bacterium]